MGAAGRLFLDACAAEGPPDWAERGGELRALPPETWRAVAEFAHRHGLAGLVARSLGWIEQATGVRAPVLGELELARQGYLARHLVIRAAARRLAEALDIREVPFIAFKGVVLAEEVYGDLSLRRFQDFDAMVPKERLDEAFSAAAELGYKLVQRDHIQDHVRAGAHAAGMVHADGSAIDLHWDISPDLPRGAAEIVWRHCVAPAPNATLAGFRLPPAMTIVHLAKHFHTNEYCALKPLVDFHVASRRHCAAFADESVGSTAQALGLSGVVDIVSALRLRSFGPLPGQPDGGEPASVRARVALRFVSEPFLLDNRAHARVGNWLRFLAASGHGASAWRSFRHGLIPGRLILERFFKRPYRADMYPRYYWRQLVKVLTLARK